MALLPWLLKMHIDFPSLRVFTFYIIHKRAHTHTPKHGYCGYPTNILLDSYGFIAQLGPCPLVIDQINLLVHPANAQGRKDQDCDDRVWRSFTQQFSM
jgi:hypothetical protein